MGGQRIELDATHEPLLLAAVVGDELLLRVVVWRTEVDLVEVTAMGELEPQTVKGEQRVICALLAVRTP